MPLNGYQISLATAIDRRVNEVIAGGGGDEELLVSLYDYMRIFKHLLDTCSGDDMDILCERYYGFYRFAKLLENLAEGIADGTIPVPPKNPMGFGSEGN